MKKKKKLEKHKENMKKQNISEIRNASQFKKKKKIQRFSEFSNFCNRQEFSKLTITEICSRKTKADD